MLCYKVLLGLPGRMASGTCRPETIIHCVSGAAIMDRDNASVVAVIDDDNDVGDVLGGLLETMGYQFETYRSGTDFLSNAQMERLACLIVDQNMPQMTGLD